MKDDTLVFDSAIRPSDRPILLPRRYVLLKRAVDIPFTLLLLLMLASAFAVIWLIVRSDGGPAFYAQTRVGRNGRLFRCFKIRTMRPDADLVLRELLDTDPDLRQEWETNQKIRNDPRVTRAGRFLRRTSLDELPQLLNVLRGEMSLVGPRPVLPPELERYGHSQHFYLQALPGMTGLWQISGRNNTTYAERVLIDSNYVRSWSISRDLWILLRTIPVVLLAHGAA
jgi:Undecaprenyl-phosphate galactose phosphotransferase WbaP